MGKMEVLEKDLQSLKGAHRVKGDRNVQLEAEILRLKMLRTDEKLREDVEGLRKDVSVKDKEIVQLRKDLGLAETASKDERGRAHRATGRADALQETMGTMQHARDAAQVERDLVMKRAEVAESEASKLFMLQKAADTTISELSKIRDQAVKVFRLLPPAVRKERDAKALQTMLREPEEDAVPPAVRS
jgi:hypothetical protein